MKLLPTELPGAFVVEAELLRDARGFFARTWCARTFAEAGLATSFVQANLSRSHRRGTLRGMHRQLPPHAEAKLVRCTHGAIHDVIIDLRPESPTYKRWTAVVLAAEEYRLLYVPERFAHGFQTLTDECEVSYQVSAAYHPAAESGVRWNDPAFGIGWPLPVTVLSEKDSRWPDFRD